MTMMLSHATLALLSPLGDAAYTSACFILGIWLAMLRIVHSACMRAYALALEDPTWLVLYLVLFLFASWLHARYMHHKDNHVAGWQATVDGYLADLGTNLWAALQELLQHSAECRRQLGICANGGWMAGYEIGRILVSALEFVAALCTWCALSPVQPIIWIVNLLYCACWSVLIVFALVSEPEACAPQAQESEQPTPPPRRRQHYSEDELEEVCDLLNAMEQRRLRPNTRSQSRAQRGY